MTDGIAARCVTCSLPSRGACTVTKRAFTARNYYNKYCTCNTILIKLIINKSDDIKFIYSMAVHTGRVLL